MKSEGYVKLKLKSLSPDKLMVARFGENCQIFFIHIIINKMRGPKGNRNAWAALQGLQRTRAALGCTIIIFLPYGKTNDFPLTYKPWTITFRMDVISPPYAQR